MRGSYTIQLIKEIDRLGTLPELTDDETFLGTNLELKLAESIYRDYGAVISQKVANILLAISS